MAKSLPSKDKATFGAISKKDTQLLSKALPEALMQKIQFDSKKMWKLSKASSTVLFKTTLDNDPLKEILLT